MVSRTWITGTADWTDPNAWSPTGAPGASDAATVSSGTALVTTTNATAGSLVLSGGSVVVDPNSGQGGSQLTITGTLTNSAFLQIGPGNGSLSATDRVSVGSLTNLPNGTIDLHGGDTAYALLNIAGNAGFGTAGFLTGQVHLFGRTGITFGGGSISTISGGADLLLQGDKASLNNGGGYNSALKALTTVTGHFELQNGASLTTNGALNNTGLLQLDDVNQGGGSSLVIGAKLTNSGEVDIGPGNNSLTAADTIKATGLNQVVNGTLNLVGFVGTPGQQVQYASLVLGGAAGFGTAGVLTGQVHLFSASYILFDSGSISTIGGGSDLLLDGTKAQISNGGGYNSALKAIRTVAGDLQLRNGAKITTTGALNNTGFLQIDDVNGGGGSSLDIDGALTSSGTINVGPGNRSLTAADTITATSFKQTVGASLNIVGLTGTPGNPSYYASLVIDSAAGFGMTGVLTGNVYLGSAAFIKFDSGSITTIGANSGLLLDGTKAQITNGGGYNSALKAIRTNAGNLELRNGAEIDTSGPLNNTGYLQIDDVNAAGGASLNVNGALTSSGTINIGPGNRSLTASDTITATSLTQAVGASLNIVGQIGTPGNPTYYASLVLDGTAGFGTAGTLSGQVYLASAAYILFDSGSIGTIKSGSALVLEGPKAQISNGGGYNSALKAIRTNAGDLELRNGATITTTGPLNNTGSIQVDTLNADGGASLTVNGTLTTSGTINIGPGNASLTSATTVHVDAISEATGGSLNIQGRIGSPGISTEYASLVVGGAAGFGTAGVLTGQVHLAQASYISFASGQIRSIASGSDLQLNGSKAQISNGNGYNSALTAITSIAGTLQLENAAKITSSGALTVDGSLALDDQNADGGSSLTITGRLTNNGTIAIGPGNSSLSSLDYVKAAGLGTTGTIFLTGSTAATAILSTNVNNTGTINGSNARVTGSVINNGTVAANGGTFKITGALTGNGQANINNGATLDLAAASSGDVTFGSGTLDLEKSAGYTGAISGFGGSDILDLSDIAFHSQTPRYTENGAGNGGTLTITDGRDTARIKFLGDYTASNFQFGSDGSGGTQVTFASGPVAPNADQAALSHALFEAAFAGSTSESAFSSASHGDHAGAAALAASALHGAAHGH